jgi:hypothetical protein
MAMEIEPSELHVTAMRVNSPAFTFERRNLTGDSGIFLEQVLGYNLVLKAAAALPMSEFLPLSDTLQCTREFCL